MWSVRVPRRRRRGRSGSAGSRWRSRGKLYLPTAGGQRGCAAYGVQKSACWPVLWGHAEEVFNRAGVGS